MSGTGSVEQFAEEVVAFFEANAQPRTWGLVVRDLLDDALEIPNT